MNTHYKSTLLLLFLVCSTLFSLQFPQQSYAAACPYSDGGFGDGDGEVNGTIVIDTNRTITATAENAGVFNCSNFILSVSNGVTLTLESYEDGDEEYLDDFGVTLQVAGFIVGDTAVVSATNTGYGKGEGPGAGITGTRGGGAGHASAGGGGSSRAGTYYGSLTQPTTLGSGGGATSTGALGGFGAGAIKIESSGDVTINGAVYSNGGGASKTTYNGAGGGSGGSIWITTDTTFTGTGTIQSNGGNGGDAIGGDDGYGGSGGRIAVSFTENTYSGTILTNPGSLGGTNGSIVLVDTNDNSLYVPSSQKWIPTSNSEFETLFPTIEHMYIQNNATLTLAGGNTTAEDGSGYGWNIDLTSFTLDSGTELDLDGQGYAGGYGPGVGGSGTIGAGGGYGGNGATGAGVTGGTTYGSETSPIDLGSGGGNTTADGGATGGAGGGAVSIKTSGNMTINGNIYARGSTGGSRTYNGAGGGAGGSIWLTIGNTFDGSGTLSVKGGDGATVIGSNDGGAGGGGRIALQYSGTYSFDGTIEYTKGTNFFSSTAANGSISSQAIPPAPTAFTQLQSDASTLIATGSAVTNTTMIAEVIGQFGASDDTLNVEIEHQEIGTAFTNIPTATGSGTAYTGNPIALKASATNLTDGSNYHWQARVCNAAAYCSFWASFGNNSEDTTDFTVVLNATPNNPTIPGSSALIDASFSNDTTPSFLFSQSDSDATDQTAYQIQIATTQDFSNPIVDYTSALIDQGSTTFTVGQAAGTGTYTAGAESQTLSDGLYYWRIKTTDSANASSDWTTASGTPAFTIDTTLPTNSITTSMKAQSQASITVTDDSQTNWFSRQDPYFSWSTTGDTSGLKGYCVYLGSDPDGDPTAQKGLLGTSPLSTTGSTCQFIVADTELDFSNTALRGETWITSSSDPYYFKIRPIDIANNVGASDTDASTMRFYLDNTAPTNVTTISASSGSLSSISDMSIYWPASGAQIATDTGSGVLGYQYALNSTETWYGTQTHSITGDSYIPTNYSQPLTLDSQIIGDSIIVGSNVFYFRTIDVAGNVSNYTTAPLEYGGEAPSFADSDVITTTPAINTENSFAFSWPQATASDGRTITRYYYMINNTPPSLLNTITSNSATYISTTQNSIAASQLANVRKGNNTIYVVAVDDANNYSQSNYISGTFTLNSTLPDPPQSLVVSDASIKSASLWRASLAWAQPDYIGTGNLTYTIQRSQDSQSWSEVATTTGLAYLDTLSNSQQYYWRVSASDNSDESIAAPSQSSAVTLIPKGSYTEPAELTSGPAASSITTKKAIVSWTTNRNSDSKISIGTQTGTYETVEPSDSTQTSEHSLLLNNLEPGTTYYYKAKWTDEDGNTGESEEKTFKTDPPPVVKDVIVKNIGIDSALIEFTTTGSAQASISYGKSTSFGGIKSIATSTLETTYSIQIDELEDGTKYYYTINSTDSEGDTYPGTILSFETLPRPQVSNIRIQQLQNTAQSAVQVTWESNTPISSIITFYPESNPEFARDAVDIVLTNGEHEMVLPGLLPETTYILVVKGRDRIGNEATSDSLRFTTATDTRAPKIIDLSIEGTNTQQNNTSVSDLSSQLVVTWTTDEPATSQVEFSEGTGTTYSQTTQEDQTLAYNHLVIISGLTPSKVYHLRAISKDSAGNISKSIDTVTITPKAIDSAFDLVITNLREAFSFLQ